MKKHLLWLIPTIFVIVLAPFTPYFDMAIASYFYSDGAFMNNALFDFVFVWGPRVVIIISVLSLVLFVVFRKKLQWKLIFLCFFLTFFLGAIVLVNGALKGFWGRPRPVQIVEFGGPKEYRPFYEPDFGRHLDFPMRSFPSGHASFGFVFFSFVVSGLRYRKKTLFYVGLFATVFSGLFLSFMRVAQGKHFFSDVVMAAFVMWIVAISMDRLVYYYGRSR